MNHQLDYSKRLTYDFGEIVSNDYYKITASVIKEFKLSPHTDLTQGVDEIFQDYIFYESVIGLEWDIWSGYTVTAKNLASNMLVEKVADFIRLKHVCKNTMDL